MKELLNDFISLIFGKKKYSTLELSLSYGFLIVIIGMLIYLREGLI